MHLYKAKNKQYTKNFLSRKEEVTLLQDLADDRFMSTNARQRKKKSIFSEQRFKNFVIVSDSVKIFMTFLAIEFLHEHIRNKSCLKSKLLQLLINKTFYYLIYYKT